jgi:hypothetical protein
MFIERDWLRADDSRLPTNQLPLLQSMLGKRLLNIERFIFSTPEKESMDRKDFFRKGDGPIIVKLADLSPVYFRDSYTYDWDEKSINVSFELPEPGYISSGIYHPHSLRDSKPIDRHLHGCIGQKINSIRILIRRAEAITDIPRALEDGIEITFANGSVFIISYYLNEIVARRLQVLYPEEVRWDLVSYAINVEGSVPLLYRFNRWKWRALDRFSRRLGFN